MKRKQNGRHIKLEASDCIAIAALVLSVVFPLVIRGCDRRASNPKLNLHVYHSHVLAPEMYPEVFDAILAANSTVIHMDRMAENAGQARKFATRMIIGAEQYHMFSVVVENRSSAPCTLSDLRVVNILLAPPPAPRDVVADTVYGYDEDGHRWEVNPLIALEPYQSMRIKFVVGFAVFPDERASKEIQAKANAMYRERTTASVGQQNGDFVVDSTNADMIRDECWLAAHSDYTSRTRLASVEFAMRDNFGKWWHAEPTKMEHISSIQMFEAIANPGLPQPQR